MEREMETENEDEYMNVVKVLCEFPLRGLECILSPELRVPILRLTVRVVKYHQYTRKIYTVITK